MQVLKKITNTNAELVVLIVTFNSKRYIKYLLESIARQDFDLRDIVLVIVDNGSQDDTFDVVRVVIRELGFPNVLLIKLDRNVGFASANNIGLNILRRVLGNLRKRILMLLNPDTMVLNKRFLRIVDLLMRKVKLWIVGFSMISGPNEPYIDSIGAYIDFLGNPQDLLCGVKLTPTLRRLIERLPRIYPVSYVCFAAVAIRGELVERMGFLRDFYVMYFEDTEFSLRAWSLGIPVYVYRDFMVWHERGGTQKHIKGFAEAYKGRSVDGSKSIDIAHHFSKNSLLLAYEYLGPLTFMLRLLIYLAISVAFKRRHLIYAILESMKIIKKKRLRWRRLPKGLVILNPRTWVFLWALKYWLSYGGDLSTAVGYGAKRASLEYVLRHLLLRYLSKRRSKDEGSVKQNNIMLYHV